MPRRRVGRSRGREPGLQRAARDRRGGGGRRGERRTTSERRAGQPPDWARRTCPSRRATPVPDHGRICTTERPTARPARGGCSTAPVSARGARPGGRESDGRCAAHDAKSAACAGDGLGTARPVRFDFRFVRPRQAVARAGSPGQGRRGSGRSSVRPLRRRADRIERPARVRIRRRKPCVLRPAAVVRLVRTLAHRNSWRRCRCWQRTCGNGRA